jgi:mRNA interferase HigB
MLYSGMRVIARNTLVEYYAAHPETKSPLERWHSITKAATWSTMSDVQAAFVKTKILNSERARFEIAGGNYRLVVAFDFGRQVAYVKFIGTHAEYDRVDALTVSQF